MPASSSSSSFGWAAYIAAAFTLCLGLAPSLSALSSGSRAGADVRTIDGIAAVVDGLKPGVTASFGISTPDHSEVQLGGHSVSISIGNATLMREVAWQLPTMALVPGVVYTATLSEGTVEVATSGRN
jgi:hypothetical protein